jgi:hypothetical protein
MSVLCSYSSLSSESIERGATLLTTVFGGYQQRAAMLRDGLIGFNDYRRRAVT